MKTALHLVKSDVAEGATNTTRPLTHSLDDYAVEPERPTPQKRPLCLNLDHLAWKLPGETFLTVPSCGECNSAIGDRYAPSKERLRVRDAERRKGTA